MAVSARTSENVWGPVRVSANNVTRRRFLIKHRGIISSQFLLLGSKVAAGVLRDAYSSDIFTNSLTASTVQSMLR